MDRYDEDRELARYIFNHCANLLTSLELRVNRAVLAEQKAASSSGLMAAKIRETWGAQGDVEVSAALSEGRAAFRARTVRRVLRDHAAEVFLNRCESCGNLVATPKAQQCLWCGHDWHSSSQPE